MILANRFFPNLPFPPLLFSNASFLVVFDHFLPVRLSPSSGASSADGPVGAAPLPGGGFPPGRSSSSSSSSSFSSSFLLLLLLLVVPVLVVLVVVVVVLVLVLALPRSILVRVHLAVDLVLLIVVVHGT